MSNEIWNEISDHDNGIFLNEMIRNKSQNKSQNKLNVFIKLDDFMKLLNYDVEVKLIFEALKIYLKEDIEKKSNAFIKLWKKTIKNLIYNHFIIFILLL